MIFFNHNSFILFSVFIWVVAVLAMMRRGWEPRSWVIMVVLTAILAAVYFVFRPSDVASERAVEIRSKIGQGMPVLLELRSQN